MNCILIDPLSSKNFWPLCSTRPVADLRIGILKISEKWSQYLSSEVSHLCRPELNKLFPCIIGEENILISGNILPSENVIIQIRSLNSGELLVDHKNMIVAIKLNEKTCKDFIEHYYNDTLSEYLLKNKRVILDEKTDSIEFVWHIFGKNGEELIKDYNLITKNRVSQSIVSNNQFIGNHIFIEEGAKVQCSILNSSKGPIYIGKNAEVMEGTVIRGPFALCENAVLKISSKIYGPTTIGPNCKVGGEVNNSVIHSNSNKAHDGFLGNAVIGEWCNIGADTNNSNLKNTYSEVKLWSYTTNNFTKTGSIFCGLIMGDHAKCGINTMFNTGTVVGVGANVFGSGFPRQFIPDFAWGGASGFSTFKMQPFLETAKAVMSRRNVDLNSDQIDLLQVVFNQTSEYRNWE
ncbi:MAG: GlmU family protein [Saprospiraceae bacterium]